MSPLRVASPSPAWFWKQRRNSRFDLSASYFVGDKAIDIECGRRAGTRTVQVLTGYGSEQSCEADFIAKDVVEAVRWIVSDRAAQRGQS